MRDPAVRATALSRVIALGGAPITLWIVATRIPPSSQGVYFVLLNLVAIATVVELGPATILVQFASHEAGRLTWTRGGDLTGGQVTARVMGNNGTIAFSSTTLGPLSNGTGDTISWSQMNVAVASNTSATALSHPGLVDGSTTSLNLPITTGTKVTNLDAKWTFTYKNTNVVASGTYGGINTNNGRVTYGVSMP